MNIMNLKVLKRELVPVCLRILAFIACFFVCVTYQANYLKKAKPKLVDYLKRQRISCPVESCLSTGIIT